jgi:hypothetical protein
MEFLTSCTRPAVQLHRGKQRPRGPGRLSRTPDSAAANNAVLSFAAGDSHAGHKIETTLGDLIVALTEETHRLAPSERETYEAVAFLLSERLTRRPIAPVTKRAFR